MFRIIVGLLAPVLFGLLSFAINPIFGVLWAICITGVVIYAVRFKN